ncbi:MAG TPA: hypothetical protein VGL62_05045, partial [Vicinamibacterales bacterium]
MLNCFRPLLLAVILTATATTALAAGQTLLITKAPAGSTAEVLLNGTKVAAGPVGPDGQATLPFSLHSAGKDQLDVNVYLDVCGKTYRVQLVDRGKTPDPPDGACDRRDISGIYWLRSVNTVVVNVGSPTPSLLLIKGAYKPPPEVSGEEHAPKPHMQSPRGLMVFGGGGNNGFSDFQTVACGDVGCSTPKFNPTYTFGAEYWFRPYVAAEGVFIKPFSQKLSGVDPNNAFSFNTTLDTRIYAAEGKVAAPVGRLKIYGHGGLDFQQSTMTTNETIQSTTVTTSDGTVLTILGGTQTIAQKTQGFSWIFGGGAEVWLTGRIG